MKKENADKGLITVMLIDPFEKKLSYKEVFESDIDEYYKLMDCQCFDIVRLGGGVIMYVDDDGLLKDNMYFGLGGVNYAGKAILARETEDGGTTDVNLWYTDVAPKMTWLPKGHYEVPYMKFVEVD